MDELIKRSDAIDALCSKGRKAWDTLAVDDVRIIIQADAVKVLMQMPVVDAVPVVRCKDCQFSTYDEDYGTWWCNYGGCSSTKKDGFCHRGIRKDGED